MVWLWEAMVRYVALRTKRVLLHLLIFTFLCILQVLEIAFQVTVTLRARHPESLSDVDKVP